MSIDRDIPNELKSFWKVFQKLAYRHQYVTVFDDYLTMCVFNFSMDEPTYKITRDDAMKKYNTEEHKLFGELFFEMLKIYSEQIVQREKAWYDFFGDLYQAISSTHKSQAMGQFFTPDSVVDMIVRMNYIQQGVEVNDPACGSGRFLIAAHAISGGCFVYGQDLDVMCCKMTVLNMVLHGCNGEVVWGNSLDLYDYKYGWQIKPNHEIRLCAIAPLPKEQSFIWQVNQNIISGFINSKPVEKVEIKEKYSETLFPEFKEEIPVTKQHLITKKPLIAEEIYQEELF
jgi:type I restriction enzyme M protein